MRIEYFPDTDSLCIDLAERADVDTREIGDGIVVDVDADGHPVAIEALAILLSACDASAHGGSSAQPRPACCRCGRVTGEDRRLSPDGRGQRRSVR